MWSVRLNHPSAMAAHHLFTAGPAPFQGQVGPPPPLPALPLPGDSLEHVCIHVYKC